MHIRIPAQCTNPGTTRHKHCLNLLSKLKHLLLCAIIVLSTSAHALTLYDDIGRTIEIKRPAQRIISLAPAITENLFSLDAGALIVGSSSHSDYPDAARQIPIVSTHAQLDLEHIASLKPDIIIVWHGGQSAAQLDALNQLNIPIYHQSINQLTDLPLSLMRLSLLIGTPQKAASVVLAAYEQIRLKPNLDRDPSIKPLSVFYQVWQQPLITINHTSWISDALTRCGAQNIFADLPLPTPTVNTEAVIKHNPDVIMTASHEAQNDGSLDEWRGWSSLKATQTNQLLFVNEDHINRPTLRMLRAAQTLCNQLQFLQATNAQQNAR